MTFFRLIHIVQFSINKRQASFVASLLLLFSMSWNMLMAQEVRLQVVTKSIEKSFPYKEGFDLSIEGQKAEIELLTWDKAEILVQVKLVAKHPDLLIAEADLEKIELVLDQEGSHIVFRNFVEEKDKETITSNIKAKYTVQVPQECPVALANYFGNAIIRDLTNTLHLKSEFTTIGISNVTGTLGVQTRYGDIVGEGLEGDVNIQAHRSNITLSQLGGTFNIDAKYGTLKIYADQSNINLNINAEKSDVYFYDTGLAFYNYALQAHNGSINVPLMMDFDFEEEGNHFQRASFKPSDELSGVRVAINVSFGEIRIGSD